MVFTSIAQIKAANRAALGHWFEPETMRFFASRVLPTVYGGRFFVSSEQSRHSWGGRRRYTVRFADDDGSIDTHGEFMGFSTRAAAVAAAKQAARERNESAAPTQT